MRPSRPKKRTCGDAVRAVGHGGGVRPTPSTRRYNYNVEDLAEDVGPRDRRVPVWKSDFRRPGRPRPTPSTRRLLDSAAHRLPNLGLPHRHQALLPPHEDRRAPREGGRRSPLLRREMRVHALSGGRRRRVTRRPLWRSGRGISDVFRYTVVVLGLVGGALVQKLV